MRGITTIFAAMLLLCTFTCVNAQTEQQTGDELRKLRQELDSIREGQRALQEDMKEIKKLLLSRQTPAAAPSAPSTVSMGSNPVQGSPKARVVLVDFSDYQCPFCGRFARETMPQLAQDYIKTDKIRYVFRDLPLEGLHPFAFKAAQAARCAGEQGKFWELHYRLFSNQNALDAGSLPFHAQAVGLDPMKFTECLNSGKYDSDIRKDMNEANDGGIQGTPYFLLGIAGTKPSDSSIKVLKVISGAQTYATFKSTLDEVIAMAEKL